MKRFNRIAVIAAAAVVLFVGTLYLWLTFAKEPGHFWRSFSRAKVTSDGSALSDARVYRRPNGMLLMDLGNNRWQLYRPDSGDVDLCNPIEHVSIPAYIYATHCDSTFCPCVRMHSAKIEVDPNLKVEPDSIEFTSFDRGRIRVAW